jgi:hypothetical protein
MLFPSSNALINLDELLLKKEMILADSSPLLLSISILRVLELTKAISIPEKKAERMSVIRMISKLI